MKVCKRCKKAKPTYLFYRKRSNKDGFAVTCAQCERAMRHYQPSTNPSDDKIDNHDINLVKLLSRTWDI
jgi:RNase P subunit RPR2